MSSGGLVDGTLTLMRPRRRATGARRAVVTGLGAITPIGNDVATFWRNLDRRRLRRRADHPVRPVGFDVRIAAEVKGFDAATGWTSSRRAA